mgnify:CR=1 FL=1
MMMVLEVAFAQAPSSIIVRTRLSNNLSGLTGYLGFFCCDLCLYGRSGLLPLLTPLE